MLHPHDHIEIYCNQRTRDAYVLATIGNQALIEYEMPAGTTALRLIEIDSFERGNDYGKNMSYRNVPKKWLRAIVEAGSAWIGRPQQQSRVLPPISLDDMIRKAFPKEYQAG